MTKMTLNPGDTVRVLTAGGALSVGDLVTVRTVEPGGAWVDTSKAANPVWCGIADMEPAEPALHVITERADGPDLDDLVRRQRRELDMTAAIDWAERGRFVKQVHRRFSRGASGRITYEVVIIPFRRRADGTLGARALPPVYFAHDTAERALREANEWLLRDVPEAGGATFTRWADRPEALDA